MDDNGLNDSAISDIFCNDGHNSIEEIDDSGIIHADDMILSREENLIEEMSLPTQEEFDIEVKGKVLTSTDPNENLAERLDKIMSPSKSLSESF